MTSISPVKGMIKNFRDHRDFKLEGSFSEEKAYVHLSSY